MNAEFFDGRAVTDRRVKITNAGDGLSKALHIDPIGITMGETIFVVLQCEALTVAFEPQKDDDSSVTRVQTLRAGTACLVDESLVGELIAQQREKNRIAEERARGIVGLFAQDSDEDVLTDEHEHGLHADGLVDGCPSCGAEVAATASEAVTKGSKLLPLTKEI